MPIRIFSNGFEINKFSPPRREGAKEGINFFGLGYKIFFNFFLDVLVPWW
jgi:hypothetical protein